MASGPEYSGSINGSLKSTLKRKLDINNSQFGVISSASDLINTILPIAGGLLVDQFGICSSTIACMLFILLGNIIDSVGATADHYQTFVAGRIVFGLGQSVLETAQRKLYYQMFPNRGLALVYALDLGFVRICNILGKVTALPIANARGYAMTYWMSVIFTALSLIANVVVVFLMSKVHQIDRKIAFDKDMTKIHRIILTLPSGFFLFAVSWIFQPSVFSTFNKIVADLIKVHYNVSAEQGGYYSALTQVIPVVLTPVGGVFVDLYGRRPQFVPVRRFFKPLYLLTITSGSCRSLHSCIRPHSKDINTSNTPTHPVKRRILALHHLPSRFHSANYTPRQVSWPGVGNLEELHQLRRCHYECCGGQSAGHHPKRGGF